jgi:endogenous inhibitor of DNA gyrase (YacG/DUF329 family)
MTKLPPKPKADASAPEPVRVAGTKCARCGQPMQARFRPFCSQRCADIDLGQWASGTYRIPTGDTPGSDEDA